MISDPSETDLEPGAQHPRAVYRLFGHERAETTLAEALEGGRLHHAWLFCGPKGVGKATLAYRFARALLGAKRAGPKALDCDPADPVVRRVAALSHPDLLVIRRGLNDKGRPRAEIIVEEARGLGAFFSLKPAEGGYRVAIIDAADDLNRNAANAILKTLEEPPPKAVVILISHAPGGLLATIRSRCRRLSLKPLDSAILAAAMDGLVGEDALAFAEGRPGRALALHGAGFPALAAALEAGLAAAARGGASKLLTLAFDRDGAWPERLSMFLEIAGAVARRAAGIASGAPLDEPDPRRGDLLARLAKPGSGPAWALAYEKLAAIAFETDALSLDPTHTYARAATILADAARGP